MAQLVKNPPAMRETWARSLGWEDPLEEGVGTHSGIFAWRVPKNSRAWRVTVHGVAESQTRLSDQDQQNKEHQSKCPSIEKSSHWPIYTRESLSRQKERKNILVSSMDGPRFIILSEVSQEGKEIYHLRVESINHTNERIYKEKQTLRLRKPIYDY